MTPASRLDIATRAQELKVVYLSLLLSLPTLLDSRLPILQWELARAKVGPNDDIPVNLRYRDGSVEALSFSAREILTKVTRLQGKVLAEDLMSINMLLGGTRLGDMISTGGFMRTDEPLLQFARHFRNACAHGDRWHFGEYEPRHYAAVRDLAITRALKGKRATWHTVSPRHYVEYLDDIAEFFRAAEYKRQDAEAR